LTVRCAISAVLLAVVVLSISGAAEEPFLYALNGVFSQISDYTYTVIMAPDSGALEATVARIRETDQLWYRVRVESEGFDATEAWTSLTELGDRFGNTRVTATWRRPGEEVEFYRHVRAESEAVYGPIVSSDFYPIPQSALPIDAYEWLGGTADVQTYNPQVKGLAVDIVGEARTELEAVVRILGWIRENVRYACGKELCEPVYRVDALATLDKGIGNCVCYANLALALLRAAGIPSMYVTGLVVDRAESHAAHAWISVYFPAWGWVEFESADWMPASGLVPRTFTMPQHITISVGDPAGISNAPFSELHEMDYEVTSEPKIVDRLEGEVAPGSSISWFVTLSSPDRRSQTIDLQVDGIPPGWYAAVSSPSVYIDADAGPLHSYEVLFTVAPPATADPGEIGSVTLTASSDGELLGAIEAHVTVRGIDG